MKARPDPLSALLRRAAAESNDTSACPDELDVARFVSHEATAEERDAFLSHAASCADCRARVADAIGALSSDELVREIAAVERSAPRVHGTRQSHALSRRRWALGGVAAAIAAVALITTQLRTPSSAELTLRDTESDRVAIAMHAVRIAGDSTRFEWAHVPGAEAYQLMVFRDDGELLASMETEDSSVTLSTRQLNGSTEAHRWKVRVRTSLDRWQSSPLVELHPDNRGEAR